MLSLDVGKMTTPKRCRHTRECTWVRVVAPVLGRTLSQLLANHEFETGPHFVNGTYFDVDEPKR